MATFDKELVKSRNPIEQVIAELLNQQPKPIAGGELGFLCPWHEDKRPSLHVNPTKNGGVYRCRVCGDVEGDVFTFVQKFRAESFKSALEWLAQRAGLTTSDFFISDKNGHRRREVAVYDYRDEHGTLLCQNVRYEPKDFKARRPDGRGGWIWNLKDVRRVLYRLPELYGKEALVIVEGEKDADTLWKLRIAATCNIGGGSRSGVKWRDDYTQQLKAAGVKRVRVIPDNDETGRNHAEEIAQSCVKGGIEARLVVLPGVPEKGDVSDYLALHSKDELISLLKNAPPYFWAVRNEQAAAWTTTLTRELVAPAERNAGALSDVLAGVEAFIRTYMVLTRDQSCLVTLWIAQTHVLEAFDYVAYVHIKSPMPECGKTRLLEVCEALVANPWLTGGLTAAALMRKVHAEHPTLLLDESDAAFGGDKEYTEALRGMLNSGFYRTGKHSACVKQKGDFAYQDFSTFCPKAIAGIGKLPSTVESRSIPVALKRREKGETVSKWRRRASWEAADPLRQRLASTMKDSSEALQAARPSFPDGLSDRAEDVLEPLFAIADVAGGPWPQLARDAAVALLGYSARVAQEAEQSLGLELLADIRAIFEDEQNPDVLPTKTIIDGLVAREDRPWATFGKSEKPINPNRLARLLKPFDVHPAGDVRIGDKVTKSYRRISFSEAFARYLPSEAQQRDKPNNDGPKSLKSEAQHESPVADSKIAKTPDQHSLCSDVAVPTQQNGDGESEDAWLDM